MNKVMDLVSSDDDSSCKRSSKRRKREENQVSSSHESKMTPPFRWFATCTDACISPSKERSSKIHWSLRKMLDVENRQIDWIVIGNYVIDFAYLIDQVPELLTVNTALVFYGLAETSFVPWKRSAGNTVDFVELDPSQPPGKTNPTQQRIMYGVHHSKFFLVGYTDQTMRVVIHTANIRHGDIELKCQGAFVQDFPCKDTNGHPTVETSHFEDDLVSYLSTYQYARACFQQLNKDDSQCDGAGLARYETLVEKIRHYDFSSAQGVLVASTPGNHMLDVTSSQKRGHLKVRDAIQTHLDKETAESDGDIVLQFSSIGSLSEKYLQQLQASMRGIYRDEQSPIRLKLVYPTVQEIRHSIEGYVGGASVPGTAKNVNKPFLRRLFHKWTSSDTSNQFSMAKHVPHMKSYYKIRSDGQAMDWFVMGSHNLSKAAWGEVQNSRQDGGRRLFIRHWELSVFTCPGLLGAELLPLCENSIPLPYPFPPEKYHKADKPWAVDQLYSEPDSFGRHSVQG